MAPQRICRGCGSAPLGVGRSKCDDCKLAARRRAYRAKNYRRRAVTRQRGDVTAKYEDGLRRKAKTCPLCQVRLVNEPFTPCSKELDHIVPLNMGGTHTIGNVRIICRQCNERRPSDGSDYVGQLTLWAEDAEVAAALAVRVTKAGPSCSVCGDVAAPGSRARCIAHKAVARGRRAAELRAGGMAWQEIASSLGYANEAGAYLAARKHGEVAVLAAWPARYTHAR